jgi:hypothetical protein
LDGASLGEGGDLDLDAQSTEKDPAEQNFTNQYAFLTRKRRIPSRGNEEERENDDGYGDNSRRRGT